MLLQLGVEQSDTWQQERMVLLPTAAYYLLIQATTDNVVTNDSSTDIVSFAYVAIIDKYWPYARSFIGSINSFMKTSRIATLIILRHQYVLQDYDT